MRNNHNHFKLKLVALTVLTSVAATELHAQALEEVIVSARKTEENVQTIPISMSAISSQVIDEQGVDGTDDVAELTAGLTFDTGLLPSDTRPVIRGLTSARGRSNVATLIDDVDVTSEALTTGGGGMTGNMRLMDLERVEVVKGPQSVLYGRSAFTGAVNYINKRPEEEFSGEVNADVDQYGSNETRLGVTGGLMDNVAARLNLVNWDGKGWDYKNPNTNDELGTGNMTGGALALEFTPTDEFTAYTRLEYSDQEYAPRATVFKRSWLNSTNDWGELAPDAKLRPFTFDPKPDCSAPVFQPFGAQNCLPQITGSVEAKESEIDLSPNPYKPWKDFPGTDVNNFRSHFDLRWEYDDYELRSITSTTRNNTHTREDFDQTNYNLNALQFPYTIDFTQPGPQGFPPDFGCTVPGPTFGCHEVAGQYGYSAASNITHKLHQFSQEFRALGTEDNYSWFLSALYWEEGLDTNWNDLFWLRPAVNPDGTPVVVNGPFGPTPGNALIGGENPSPAEGVKTTQLGRNTYHHSLAGSLTYDLTDTVAWTVEGRYLEERVNYTGTNEDRGSYTIWWNSAYGPGLPYTYCDFSFTSVGNTTAPHPCGTSKNHVTSYKFVPRTSINWQVTDDALAYFTYAEGFKPGGVDTTAASGNVNVPSYDPEKLKTYEIGTKTAWLDNQLYVNGAIFYYDYTDLQQAIQVQPPNSLTTTSVVNAGSAENIGFEFDVTYRVIEPLTVTVGYIYSDATYTDFDLLQISEDNTPAGGTPTVSPNNRMDAGNASGNYDDNQLPQSSKQAATLAVRYEDEVSAGMTGFVELNGAYQDKRYLTPGNNAYLPSHDIWAISSGVDTENWRAIVYVENMFDDDTIQSGVSNTDYGFLPDGQTLTNGASLQLPQPRTIGIRGTYRF